MTSIRSGAETLELLRRSDKHFLGAGDGLVFDAPHPLWLDRPAFWDSAHLYLHTLHRPFTVSFVRPDGGERGLRLQSRSWTPAAVTATYATDRLALEASRTFLRGGRLVEDTVRLSGGDREVVARIGEAAEVRW